MAEIKDLEIKIKPKFVIDTDTAYQCLTLLEMYCNSHNEIVEPCLRKTVEEDEWHIALDFRSAKDFENEKRETVKEVQDFVEKRCKELGIDYTQIFTCNPVE